MTDQTFGLIE